MTVKELKELLEKVPDDSIVVKTAKDDELGTEDDIIEVLAISTFDKNGYHPKYIILVNKYIPTLDTP